MFLISQAAQPPPISHKSSAAKSAFPRTSVSEICSAKSGTSPAPLRLKSRAARLACARSEEHTSELQSLMRISYAVFCLKQKKEQKSASLTKQTPVNTNI